MSREETAIQNLLQCSEKAEEDLNDFQRVVATFSWQEVATGWRNSAPNVIYQSSERKKKSKEKQSKTTSLSVDHENHYLKVRKLAGMIANSSLQANGALPTSKKAKSNMLKFKNLDVLSYDMPCWRYILDPRTCCYVERKPLQLLRCVNEKKRRTTVLENGGVVSFQEINGEALFVDPALSFDRHLLETLDHREDFRLKSDIICSSLDVPKVCSSFRTENNRIRVVHTGFATNMSPRVDGPRNVNCRQNTQTDSKTKELKPLEKVTPIQRRAAEDSILASKMLMARAKELKSESSTQINILNKKNKTSKNKCAQLSNSSRVDWVPITASTFHYQTHYSTAYENPLGYFPCKPGCKFKYGKTVSLRPLNDSKENKLTLNEVANLMPSENNVSTTVDKLAKELESKKDSNLEIGVGLSPDLLPTVLGKKLLMTSETGDDYWPSL